MSPIERTQLVLLVLSVIVLGLCWLAYGMASRAARLSADNASDAERSAERARLSVEGIPTRPGEDPSLPRITPAAGPGCESPGPAPFQP